MIYTIENQVFSVSVESKGAQLKSIFSKETGIEYLWQGDEKYWMGRAYNLFPYVGRLAKGKYVVGGKEFAMDRHGFARGEEFSLLSSDDLSMTFALKSNERTKAVYPFDFTFLVKFTILNKSLTVTYKVVNDGNLTMYFGLGGHPGFNVPFDGGEFEDYYIHFEKDCVPTQVFASEKGLITPKTAPYNLVDGKNIPLKHYLFDNDAIILTDVLKSVYLKGKGTDKAVKVSYPNMENLGFWHMPKTDAPFVCIEPWMTLPANEGEPEVLETKKNIGVVEKGNSFETDMIIEIIE
ncbi:MAG: aldose 1-epimerase family protein [Clostridia bacterium]|nr:aldose 1-epimerase family protein [Clostridia bacterium]